MITSDHPLQNSPFLVTMIADRLLLPYSRELHDASGVCMYRAASAFGTHPVMRLGQLLFDPQTLFLFPSTTNLETYMQPTAKGRIT
ncbi:hypothetical protein CPSG_03657 [Coccidioides posadasii str. Silveira]|uniref:Uncharacterized protein n=1 Tax=Coccidioides posadasii (strain RMSCC 757 / Silveira) TaxID=443226 RepID=E9D259_COCPS|nr:hypothetical protein CPSG_03657 [Coccidioides posadasii str. Silveira]